MQLKALCLGAVLSLSAAQVFAEQSEAAQWLQRLQESQTEQAYQGTFVYERKGAFSTHQVQRQVDVQGRLLEHFVQLNGPAHEVFRVDGRVQCMSSAMSDQLAQVDLWPAQQIAMQHLERWYEPRLLGNARVAGHITTVLLFAPRDQHRYPVEIHLERDTATLLKSLLFNEQGQLLERLQFVQFQKIPSHMAETQTLIQPSADCVAVADQTEILAITNTTNWSAGWIPPGFMLLNSHSKKSVDRSGNVISQVYSDGLAHFTVFTENIDNLEIDGGRRQLGPTAVVSRKVTQADETVMVTVVGEIPLGSAERVALSMRAVQQEQVDD
ncbi:MAG TPA: MucB/RseB C-terminal domain-containing protein [Thiopseudomonas sp.]|nr:MucB/RseB C-terminal domain-containing protein [Thiopseudomonas sp.]